ncbi:MAG: right-handed parallel beta-helix repeat-containing protein [Thermoplasmatales archaeon]|nr:MAG: right-handed parallel beta-helix repeat-containing protein [Thermoplasmatales archaeon]
MKYKSIIFLITILFIVASFASSMNVKYDFSTNEIIRFYKSNHPPIYINDNDDFTQENGVTEGNGTKENPYIIENWIIEGDGSDGNGIFINGTNAYFIIRNCTVSGFYGETGSSWGTGVRLVTVENGRIEDTTTYMNYLDIRIEDNSKYIKIDNCSSYNYSKYLTKGINCRSSSNINISYYECFNKDEGIFLYDVSFVLIEKSKFYNNTGNGISLYGENIKHITLKDCKIYHNKWYGIYAEVEKFWAHSAYIHIANCEIFNNALPEPQEIRKAEGIFIWNLHDNIIENCSIYHNGFGIYIESRGNIIRNCSIFNHSHGMNPVSVGVHFVFGRGLLGDEKKSNTLLNCDVYNNEIGIWLEIGKAIIYKNNVFNNGYFGIRVYAFSNGKVTYNNIYDNGYLTNYTIGVEVTQFSFANLRHNYWGVEDGPSLYLLDCDYNRYLLRDGGGDNIYFKRSLPFMRPWSTELIQDAGVK